MRIAIFIAMLAFSTLANALTDEELMTKIDSLASKAKVKHLAVARDFQGRVKVNGEPFIDPEGEIRQFAMYSSNGLFSYLVATNEKMRTEGGSNYALKVGNPTNNKSIQIGVANISNVGVTVFTATDEKINGDVLTLTSDGFILVRKERYADTVFIYEPGKGLSTHRFELGKENRYRLFPKQTGDILGTRKLLVYKESSVAVILTGATISWFDIDTKDIVGAFSMETLDVKWILGDDDLARGNNFARWTVTPAGNCIGVAYDAALKEINMIDFRTGKKYPIFKSVFTMTNLGLAFEGDSKAIVSAKLPGPFASLQKVDVDDLISNPKTMENPEPAGEPSK